METSDVIQRFTTTITIEKLKVRVNFQVQSLILNNSKKLKLDGKLKNEESTKLNWRIK